MNSKKSDEPNQTQDQQTPSEVYKLTLEKYLKILLLRKKNSKMDGSKTLQILTCLLLLY